MTDGCTAFRKRHGERRRDLVLYVGRQRCGLKLRELSQAVGLRNQAVVVTNARRYELRLARDRVKKARMIQVLKLLNCGM